jgi:hypothetical protein
MLDFDYVEHAGFRSSLESDYREMKRCVELEAWKSAQVLAGSIVEGLLMDYLVSRPDANSSDEKILKLDLSDAIAKCREQKAISDRTADLCAVIRSYRNLIHPARLIRLREASPTKASCDIAVSLIELILDDIRASRRLSVGLTADQVLAKVVNDSKSAVLIKHLLADVRESQLFRLATLLLPEALARYEDDFDDVEIIHRIRVTFRAAFEALPESRKTEVADGFAMLLRSGSDSEIDRYRRGLFRAPDIRLVSPQYREMVKDHLLTSLGPSITLEDMRSAVGIATFLSVEDAIVWTNNIIRVVVSSSMAPPVKKRMQEFVVSEHDLGSSSAAFDDAVVDRLDAAIARIAKSGDSASAETLRGLKLEIELPF